MYAELWDKDTNLDDDYYYYFVAFLTYFNRMNTSEA